MNEVSQCAGAAIMRANLGVADKMPDSLLHLPPSPDAFRSLVEFYAHHTGCTWAEAEEYLTPSRIAQCMRDELSNTQVRMQFKRREAA